MIQDLKDLEKLFKLCRKHGVTEVNLGFGSIKLGDLPRQSNQSSDETEDGVDDGLYGPLGTPLTQEEMAFFSNGGNPQENPYRNVGNS